MARKYEGLLESTPRLVEARIVGEGICPDQHWRITEVRWFVAKEGEAPYERALDVPGMGLRMLDRFDHYLN